jgi:hypothetical protein
MQPVVSAEWNIDSVGLWLEPLPTAPIDCNSFSGNVWLSGTGCPGSAGPLLHGEWSGPVMVSSAGSDTITASDGVMSGSSNSFTVSATYGASATSFETDSQFTHVLAIEVDGDPHEHFNITTAPLYHETTYHNVDHVPEQIGVINVVPNDFALGFHQNETGTYLYSQQDTVTLNIPDNNSLGLHDFRFWYFDRFNNTFFIPYTIWLRQPTSIILKINTEREGTTNLALTDVNITAQLLFQRFDKPLDKPDIPLGGGYNISLYVQNSSTSFYGDLAVMTMPATAPLGCDPSSCPVSQEESNCSCPDWWDDPANPGDCISNPNCHQYGILSNTTGGYLFATNRTGEVNTTFGIYGFGRRLMFVVFNGTREYAPSIQIQPFYAGGMSIEMGKFSVLEPVLLVLAAMGFLAFKRKFNK